MRRWSYGSNIYESNTIGFFLVLWGLQPPPIIGQRQRIALWHSLFYLLVSLFLLLFSLSFSLLGVGTLSSGLGVFS